jgi:CRP-like cAMP-binding protein
MPGRPHIDVLLNKLGNHKKSVFFHKGEIIFSQGDSSDSLFYVQQGNVKLTVTSEHGKEAVVALLGSGDFFGENAFALNQPVYGCGAVALTDVRVLKIDPDGMLDLFHADKNACDAFISSLVRFKAQIIGSYADSLLYFADERLARMLSAIARSNGDPEGGTIPKLNQQDLADILGVSRQRVNVLLKKVRKAGQVTNNPYTQHAGSSWVPELLASTIEAMGAEFGNVQLLDSSRQALTIVAHHGLESEFLTHFQTVHSGTCCGEAMNQRSRVIVSDVASDPLFRDKQTRDLMLRAHIRSCQSTPLIHPSGKLIGVISTGFDRPRRFSPRVLKHVDNVISSVVAKMTVNGETASK